MEIEIDNRGVRNSGRGDRRGGRDRRGQRLLGVSGGVIEEGVKAGDR